METTKQTNTKIQKYDMFVIIENETIVDNSSTKSYKIAFGDAIISSITFDTLEEAQNYIDSPTWDLIFNVMCYTFEKLSKNETK